MSTSPAPRRAIVSWMVYDFANSAFTTLVVTFVYATYFTEAIAPDSNTGTALWSRGITASAIIIALLSPIMGALADRGGSRKVFLLISTVVCIAATVGLFFPLPGDVTQALVWFVVANVAFEMANVFYNAYLPDLATPSTIGRISGYGWGAGYVGGLACMILAWLVFINADAPPFGLLKDGTHVRATNLLVAAWYAVFALPFFFLVKDPKGSDTSRGGLKAALQQIKTTFTEVRRFRQIVRLLVARLVYNDGLITIFAFGGIYAAGTFGFTTNEIFFFGIALNVSAGVGALLFGFLDDYVGGRWTILVSLVGLSAATVLAVLTTNVTLFWVSGILVGLLAGPNQSASRSLMGRFVPPAKETEFYGFFAFSGKFTAFMGPLFLGLLTEAFDSQRVGVSVVLVFFLVGGLLLLRVNEQEGIELAGRNS
ncbi:MAG: MFS transporter [Bacteroidota bacterium]